MMLLGIPAAASALALLATPGPTNCFANPSLQHSVKLLEPHGAAPATNGRLWILIEAAPSGEDIRAALTFAATAEPLAATEKPETLAVQPPIRISSRLVDAPPGRADEPRALWILPVQQPRLASNVYVTYTVTVFGHDDRYQPCRFTGATIRVGVVQWTGEQWPR